MTHRAYVYRKQGSYGRTEWYRGECEDCNWKGVEEPDEMDAERAAQRHRKQGGK